MVRAAPFILIAIIAGSTLALAEPSDCGKEKPIKLGVMSNGKLTWDGFPVSLSEVKRRIKTAAHQRPMPNVRVFGQKDTKFSDIATIFKVMQDSGLHCPGIVGFITAPPQR